MTKEQRKELKSLKSRLSQPKSDLIRIASQISAISPKQGDELLRIIGRLESWQNR